MKARQYLNKSTVLMLHYDDLVSHLVLQSLRQLFQDPKTFLCVSCPGYGGEGGKAC